MATAALRKQQRALFSTITSEGTPLPVDMLQRIEQFDPNLVGMTSEAYHKEGSKLNEAINMAWLQLLPAWNNFQNELNKPHVAGKVRELTLNRWLLHIFEIFGYGRFSSVKPPIYLEGKEKSYPITYGWGNVPIHLVGYDQELDTVFHTSGTRFRNSAYSLVQELLNNSNDHLWGIVSNGKILRLLRRNVSLTRQAYVEFDLERMMQGEAYADFALFWLLCHQSRFEGERPADCWLEQWTKMAQENGVRALDQLRDGVEQAINALGKGFLTSTSPANFQLRTKLRDGTLSSQDYYRQVLRLVYRLIILFVAEDRDVLFRPHTSIEAKQRYLSYYSTKHLRQLAEQRIGTRHTDLYRSLSIIMDKLGSSDGYDDLGLPALNGFLFSADSVKDLAGCGLTNYALMDAIRSLSTTYEKGIRRTVDYKNLGSEELGSVYESLLELHPDLTIGASGVADFKLKHVSGNERKTSGSYYTPTSLIDCLLDSALDPVLEEAYQGKNEDDAEQAILNLKICDPACGSGHFLIAAAHRIAKKLAAVRTGDEEPAPKERREALRDVVGRCIYGVDVNPMAVELCKVNLWMESIEPSKPLSFLDAHILIGNSLLGATPILLKNGIPDSAFEPIEGDDKKTCIGLRKRNKEEHTGQMSLWTIAEQDTLRSHERLVADMKQVQEIADDSVDNIHHKQILYEQLKKSDEYQTGKLQADAWCAAFIWKKVPNHIAITQDIFRNIQNGKSFPEIEKEIQHLAQSYYFFHWYLEFPDVFSISKHGENEKLGWSGGFDVVLGNSPWERIKMQEKEWFAARKPEIANAPNASLRKNLIANLRVTDPDFYAAFTEDQRQAIGESHFVRDSGLYPLCGRGDVNTYAIFAEVMRHIQSITGRVGCIVPSGIATDDTTKFFFQDLMQTQSLASLYSFENREKLFPAVHSSYNFALLTLTNSSLSVKEDTNFIFFAHKVADIQEDQRRFTLSKTDIELLNPNTRTCPIFRTKRDIELAKTIYKQVPVLAKDGPPKENLWKMKFNRMLDMTNDANLFRTREQLESEDWQLKGNVFYKNRQRWMPIFEGKMTGMYDYRAASIEIHADNALRQQQPHLSSAKDHKNPYFATMPYLWCPDYEGHKRTPVTWSQAWFPVVKQITASTNERTLIGTIIPWTTASYTLYVMTCDLEHQKNIICLFACMCSFIGDYILRQKHAKPSLPMGVIYECAFLPPSTFTKQAYWHPDLLSEWIKKRVLELTYTGWDLKEFAKDYGYNGFPFHWDEERRFLMRCELDAAYFHLYDIAQDDIDYIMETFPIVKRKDEKEYGEYRTKRVILEIYDEMQQAVNTGEPYRTRLDPPPADPAVAHPARVVEA